MSDIRREHITTYRNLYDSRVKHGPRSVSQSFLLTSTTGKALDIPILSFDDNLFPGSPCPSSVVPESPHLYDVGIDEQFRKAFMVVNGDQQETVQLQDLDPTLEESVDIDKLLNSQLIGETNLEDYILNSKLSLDLESGHALDTGTEVNNGRSSLTPQTVSVQREPEYMHQDQIEDILGSDRVGWPQIVTIKAEDLVPASCQQQPVDHVLAAPPTPPTTPAPPLSPASSIASSTELISPRGPLPRGRPGRKPSGTGPIRPSRKRQLDKESDEYRDKRVRNNVAVRKSRDKAKIKQAETEGRVDDLVSENEALQKKVELLSKELNVLKSLFVNVGAALPENFLKLLENAS